MIKMRLFYCFPTILCLVACNSLFPKRPVSGYPSAHDKPPAGTAVMGSNLTVKQVRALHTTVSEYKLGAGDVISLWAEDIAGMNRSFVLGPDGKVTIPDIGVIGLANMTRSEAMTLIEGRLKAHYRSPKVSLLVEAYNNNRISVLGEVKNPGEFNFSSTTTLLNVLAKAGGPTEAADLENCTIVRGNTVIAKIDLRDLLHKGNLSMNIVLIPNDSVYIRAKSPTLVGDTRTFYVLGEVQNPGVFPIAVGPGEYMDALRAISLAGGNTEKAEMSRVRIIRRNPEGPPTVTKIDLDDLLHGKQIMLPEVIPGDIVFVPEKGLATFK